MRKFIVVVEEAGKNFSAFCPNLPGCVATGDTSAEAFKNMKEAIELHLAGLKEDGQKPPKKTAKVKEVLVG
ncbi:MAG: hypothetical protein CO113_13795 [Elusimicrobia bacterium CG_4_9_14_3_um_filter_62_55]|nr:MAG: hypothetical protein COR54_12100 [Elusimicrobia bacterium CG22_combo_CG10-13_8_21_14_all_63_91]PJA13223.1 MAG: hypothetical protein COX66_15325 [Elusimicrobia bacterium CG_4_10_14_0_2_um_filter_63_34]PJB24465.1 MAG: hypothetical protein CO113_13795 [Elusimicrobia bacterium CG_4_9_14_3_um_filter_62_55]